MAITTRTIAEIREDIVAALSVSDPNLDTSEGADAWILANAVAGLCAELQAQDVELSRATLPTTSTGDDLDAHAGVWLPSTDQRRAATQWFGSVVLWRNDLIVTPVVPAGAVLVAADGTQYETVGAVAAVDWIAINIATTAKSVDTHVGTVANKPIATPLTVSAPPGGLSSAANILYTTTAASDEESDELLRARNLEVTAGRPGSGNASDYVTWLTACSGVYAAFCYPRFDGIGTVSITPLGPPRQRILGGGTVAALQAAIDAARPCGCLATVELPTPHQVSVAVTIRQATGYEPGYAGNFTTAALAHTTTRVYVTADPTATIAAGDWIVVPIGANDYSCCRQVVATATGAQHYIDVSTPFETELGVETAPLAAGGKTVRPGASNYEAMMDALFDVFDTLGPSACSTSGRQRYPAPATSWCPYLYLSDLYAAIEGVSGIVSCDIAGPAANHDNTIVVTGAIFLLTLDPEVVVTWGTFP